MRLPGRLHPRTASALATAPAASSPSLRRRVWLAVSGALAVVLGIAPHVLHHAGPLAGAALLGGIGGSLVFGALGFLLAIPLLIKMYHRFGSWQAPAVALVVFAAAFTISTFVVGPAISGSDGGADSGEDTKQTAPGPATEPSHEEHHQ